MTQLIIEKVGHLGDGLATHNGDAAFVPLALPGETVSVSGSGPRFQLKKIEKPSDARVAPQCQHFGVCGGCATQHWAMAPYLEWKRQLVVDAFAARGLEPEVEPCIAASNHTRRRATFSCIRDGGGVRLGFSERNSHDIFQLEECVVLVPAIVEALPVLQKIADIVATGKGECRLHVLSCENGIDVTITGVAKLLEPQKQAIVRLSQAHSITRVSYEDEVLIELEKPRLLIDGIVLNPQPNSFAQATEQAENAIAAIVCDFLSKEKRVADLFSGFGTFSLRLARQSNVHAVEDEAEALAALEGAWRNTSGMKKLTHEPRDLFRRAVTTKELSKFTGLVFDPPRTGALEQATQIAASHVKRVAAVSCNPATLARDARILIDGGYELTRVVPVDQFIYSPHVEVVALFENRKAPPRKPIFG